MDMAKLARFLGVIAGVALVSVIGGDGGTGNIAYANHYCSVSGLSIVEHHDVLGTDIATKVCSDDGSLKCSCTGSHEQDWSGNDKMGYPKNQCVCASPEAPCPTDCGMAASQVSNGKGGVKNCPATAACCECPDNAACGDGDGCGNVCGGSCEEGKICSADYQCIVPILPVIPEPVVAAPPATPVPETAPEPEEKITTAFEGERVGSCSKELNGTTYNTKKSGYYVVCEGREMWQYPCTDHDMDVPQCNPDCKPDCTDKCDGGDNGCSGKCYGRCPEGKTCEDEICVKMTSSPDPVPVKKAVCTAGARKCTLDEVAVSQCDTGGTGWSEVEQCGALGCINGVCVKKPAGFFKCEGVKAGDKCDPNGNKVCGWNGSNHCYCKQSGSDGYKYAFNNNLADYCKQCSSKESKTGLCDCSYVDNAGKKIAVPFGKSYCGSVFTLPGKANYFANISYTCVTPGTGTPDSAKIANCINGMKCVAGQGCAEPKSQCVAMTKDIRQVYVYVQNKNISANGKNLLLKNGACAKNDTECGEVRTFIKDLDSKYGGSFVANIAKRAADAQHKYLFTNGADPISCSDKDRPVCLGDDGAGSELEEAYICRPSTYSGTVNTTNCLVWDWVNGVERPCTLKDDKYCEYNGVDPDTKKEIPTGRCAQDKEPIKNEINAHTLRIEGDSLVETVTTDLDRDHCIANCSYCSGANCAIVRPLVSGFKMENKSGNVSSVDYTVRLILSRGPASFQCDAQCWNGSAKTSVVKSEPVSFDANADDMAAKRLGSEVTPESQQLGNKTAPATQCLGGNCPGSGQSCDLDGAKLTGSRCAVGGKCYYKSRGQACGQTGVYCAGTVNKPAYLCFGKTLKSLIVTPDGLDCDYLKIVRVCGSNQKCSSAKGVCE